MKGLYKLNAPTKYGDIEGIFISEKSKVDELIKNKTRVYFGEFLGEYAPSDAVMTCDVITLISDDQEIVERIDGLGVCFGANPFEFEFI